MSECICIVCKERKEHQAKGMCRSCYSKEWTKNNPERRKELDRKASKKWYAENPEKCKEINKKYLKENPEKARKYYENQNRKRHNKEICEILKEHDIRHKDDEESLDIRKFLDVEC